MVLSLLVSYAMHKLLIKFQTASVHQRIVV